MRETDDNRINIHDSSRNFKIGGNDIESIPRYSVGRRDWTCALNLYLDNPHLCANVLTETRVGKMTICIKCRSENVHGG